jgi:5-methylcytosine-specific restriction endonuclease McrA
MPFGHLCIDCSRLFAEKPTRGRCPDCGRLWRARDNRRRQAKGKAHGRHTAHWKRLRRAVLERDGRACVRCGAVDDLTVHIDPRFADQHSTATAEVCITLCRRCHGRLDGARARVDGTRERGPFSGRRG